jgi:hypothetical protein
MRYYSTILASNLEFLGFDLIGSASDTCRHHRIAYILITPYIEVGSFKKEPVVADDTDQVSQDDQQLLPRQFTTVFEYLINVSGFELPFIVVLLDAEDIVVRNTITQSSENENVLSAVDFVCSEGADEGLSYPMHMMVRDANENVAYGYLGDIDAQPEVQIVHVGEPE